MYIFRFVLIKIVNFVYFAGKRILNENEHFHVKAKWQESDEKPKLYHKSK